MANECTVAASLDPGSTLGNPRLSLTRAMVRDGGPEIALSILGSGPTMILLHGIGSSGMSWMPVMSRLADQYRLVIADLRGHGKSGHPAAGYTLDDYADDLERVIAATGEPRPILVGHSLGGLTAVTWARRHPGTASAIVLEDMPLSGGMERAPVLRGWAELAALPIPDVIAYYGREHPDWSLEERTRRAEIITSTHPAVFTEMIDLSMRESRVDYLADLISVASPICLIHGDIESGGLVPPDGARRFAALGANFSTARIPGGSHSLHRDFTDAFLNAMRVFLEGH